MDNIQTGLRRTISLKAFFVEDALDFKIFINSFLPTFLRREETYSLKLKSLSITIPNNFCFELSQVFTSIRAQIFSCLYPETNKTNK